MASKDERKRRMGVIEKTMQDVGWSGRIVRALAKEFKCTERTVYRMREEVLEDLAKGYRGMDVEKSRAEFMARLRSHQQAAKTAGQFGPLGSMMSIEAKVRGLDAEVATQVLPVRVEIHGLPDWGSAPTGPDDEG